MQATESALLGQTQKGSAAATMQAAAMRNERAGLVEYNDVTSAAIGGSVNITETTDLQGEHVISKSVGGQVPLCIYVYVVATNLREKFLSLT